MRKDGISLIEVVISAGLLLIVGAALLQLGVTALNNSDASRMRSVATQTADQALEIARSRRDTDPATFFGYSGNYTVNSTLDGFNPTNCQANPLVTSATNPCVRTIPVSGAPVPFYTVVNIADTAGHAGLNDSKDVAAYVYWDLGGGKYSEVVSSTRLTRWR